MSKVKAFFKAAKQKLTFQEVMKLFGLMLLCVGGVVGCIFAVSYCVTFFGG